MTTIDTLLQLADRIEKACVGSQWVSAKGVVELIRSVASTTEWAAPLLVQVDQPMVDLVNVECANVLIGELGHHLWVCTENGTALRIKAGMVTLDDRRISRDNDVTHE